MQRPDEEILNAMVSLTGDNRWEKIHQWIKDSHHQAVKDLVSNTIFNAGRVAELFDFISKISTARRDLEEIRRNA